jgi:hypothetical protein
MSAVAKVFFVGGCVLVAPILYNAVTTYLAADKLEFSPVGIDHLDVSHGDLKFNFSYSLFNPTNKEIDVTNFLLAISFDKGPTIATIVKTDKLAILPGVTVKGSVPVESSKLIHLGVDLLSNIITWIETKSVNLPKQVLLLGHVTANGFDVPFCNKIALPI